MEKEIESLDDKYRNFQENFISISKETNDFITQIENAYKAIESLKEKQKGKKQQHFMKKYKYKEIYSKIMESFHECNSKPVFAEKVKKILNVDSLEKYQDK